MSAWTTRRYVLILHTGDYPHPIGEYVDAACWDSAFDHFAQIYGAEQLRMAAWVMPESHWMNRA